MNTCICPKGHESTEADYCSECGAKIEGSASVPTPALELHVSTSSAETCPECGIAREPSDVVFCEICGYNFVTGARGELPAFSMPAAVAAQPVPLPLPTKTWELIVSVDAALRESGSPEVPAGINPSPFRLEATAYLIGRKSEARAIFPEIALFWDDAVSHRHALLQLDSAGGLVLRDIGSSNGTRLNGAEVPPMTDQSLADGDQITLGHWTRITVKAVD